MNNLLNYLYTQDEIFKQIVITSVEYQLTSNILVVKAQYTCDTFSDVSKEKLASSISEFFGRTMRVEIKCKKYYVDEDVITQYITDYIVTKLPSVDLNTDNQHIDVAISGDNMYIVNIYLAADSYAYLDKLNFVDTIRDYLQLITKEEYTINLISIDTSSHNDDILTEREHVVKSSDIAQIIDYEPIEVNNITNIIGDISADFVYPIASIVGQEKAIFCGTIKYYRVTEYESRFKSKDGTVKKSQRANFVLFDGSGRINCVLFPKQSDIEKLEDLSDEEQVIVAADIEDNEERGLSCKIKSIAKCTFSPYQEPVKEIKKKSVNADYKYIFPKPYIVKTQSDLFTEAEVVDEYLLNNEIVVFDLETTGLNVNECEIIEIGAVKMRGGQIVETFDTLVKPKLPIPADATKVNNITNEMVADCLDIDKVFPDFYKFIDGTVLVAYNIAYDCGVLQAYGDKNGYDINNKQLDALKLARIALPGYKSHKLGKVVKLLNIKLDNAHRALFDTIATAEVLKVTLNMLTKEDKEGILP